MAVWTYKGYEITQTNRKLTVSNRWISRARFNFRKGSFGMTMYSAAPGHPDAKRAENALKKEVMRWIDAHEK